jgi:hypothetical protein
MGIQIIQRDERLTCSIEGVVFTYRRMLPDEIKDNRERHTKRGALDDDAAAEAALRLCVLGWDEKLTDMNGKPVPYSPDIVPVLPQGVQGRLLQVIGLAVGGEHLELDPIITFGSSSRRSPKESTAEDVEQNTNKQE